ncbi:DUF3169 family protein [Bacillus paranthracis]|uniref:DUF3169 family protein n=1 Tax=Bacillus TaxID=1386 RepID=UPI000200EEB9|nr:MULTISPECIES: DUF3169 family protein [Bacillus]ADY24228.1 hypothetical protein YBT020_25005 [Bacillus thuringiensis serovar finitimus YBT-020]MCW4575164.1 DUF3169 family protein [Bacillus pacificus]OTX67380.1 DUF3169 domain-containing protein [Bacillus thuringiensis serovar finitimus]MCR6800522.1 DUF3169 family protein [Bacillus paranthracis]MEC3360037.1 DUF3169 family protein [Bacillus paranthracis]
MKGKQSAIVKLLVGAVFGGFIGYVGGDIATTSTSKMPSVISIVIMMLLGVGAIYYIGKRTRALLQTRDEEESSSGRRLGIALIYLRVMEIVVMSWFVCSVISVYKVYVAAGNLFWVIVSLTLSTVGFMITTWLGSVTRKKYNTLYPEQSVTYSQSMEMWAKNADEGQQQIVHEAGYKAYRYTNMTLVCAWFVAIVYALLDGKDFLMVIMISFIWVLHVGTYMYEMHRKMIY